MTGMRKLVLLCAMVAAVAGVAIPSALGRSAKIAVAVKLKEFKVLPSPTSAKAGPVAFTVKNTGALAHEFDVVKTNLPVAKLPVKGSRVTLKPLGKVGPLQPGKSAVLGLSLKPGKYVLYCNVSGHYQAGQRVGFTVK
jgi:uncharacterized cupredoxin-like copper-binding protein